MRRLRQLINATLGATSVVEITARTAQNQFLLRPDPEINSLIAGILARAKRRYGVRIYGDIVMSSHLHLLIGTDSAQQMKNFMNYVMGNIGRKVNRSRGRTGPFWQARYKHIEVSTDEETLCARLDYFLRQGVASYCTS